ncbi:unknown protein [Nostoc sp. NIES-3756]|uniref:exosortase-dependent surface protein XDP2 n=1 Tax=Nostoc sp. NIES-3756 TaxID=1751286 RepID=UPI000722C4D0|nr:exosortase-dependent surface protein XDP2 [Nostoc sp. NIES-3756]BAT56330.1 unknown protein [Nostoc sp. NIES-3756]
MKAKKFLFSTGLALSAVVGVSSAAQAATFTTDFNPDSPNPKQNIFLNSITLDTVPPGINPVATFGTNLFTVSQVDIKANKGAGLGGGGADNGDEASAPAGGPKDNLALTDGSLAAAYLGNNNLNNIIDTEDDGFFTFEVTFDDAVASLPNQLGGFAFFERGGNSDIKIEAFDADGTTVIGSFFLTRNLWKDAGYSIDTTEVGGAQSVGSYLVTLEDLGLGVGSSVSKIRLIAENGYNGPDFKVFGANFTAVPTTPEPTTILGLGSIAALALVGRRRAKKASL